MGERRYYERNDFDLILDRDIEFLGEVESTNYLLRGYHEGQCQSSSIFFIDQGSHCVAKQVKTKVCYIQGQFEGLLHTEEVSLLDGAQVKGDLFCKKLITDYGSVFNGKCHMKDQENKKNTSSKNNID